MKYWLIELGGLGWENFCETMLRHKYGEDNFFTVPDTDGGDLGVEFFTSDGTMFQCYFPEPGVAMSQYKTRVQNKIREDLHKLQTNEKDIAKMLGEISIKQWVLLLPEYKSKAFLAYCEKKKKEVRKLDLSFINSKKFMVKIETSASYPTAENYARFVSIKSINIPVSNVSATDQADWIAKNTEFRDNVVRKSTSLFGRKDPEQFQSRVITRYIQIERFLDKLREDFPDFREIVDAAGRTQLEELKDDQALVAKVDQNFIRNVLSNNKKAFEKLAEKLSNENIQSLSFGFLSKWITECDLDIR